MAQFKHTIINDFNLKKVTVSYKKYLYNLIVLLKNYECYNYNYACYFIVLEKIYVYIYV